jgi:hypothetical protein
MQHGPWIRPILIPNLMLRSVSKSYGDKLVASDADIGHVQDFYFDDEQWIVRYVVVDTGSWLSGRLVLIPPFAFDNFTEYGDCLRVSLTREQIAESPAAWSHNPISRQSSILRMPALLAGKRNVGAGGLSDGSSQN